MPYITNEKTTSRYVYINYHIIVNSPIYISSQKKRLWRSNKQSWKWSQVHPRASSWYYSRLWDHRSSPSQLDRCKQWLSGASSDTPLHQPQQPYGNSAGTWSQMVFTRGSNPSVDGNQTPIGCFSWKGRVSSETLFILFNMIWKIIWTNEGPVSTFVLIVFVTVPSHGRHLARSRLPKSPDFELPRANSQICRPQIRRKPGKLGWNRWISGCLDGCGPIHLNSTYIHLLTQKGLKYLKQSQVMPRQSMDSTHSGLLQG